MEDKTKQEEIREGLIKFFTPPNTTFKDEPILEENIKEVVKQLLEHLASKGIVIKGSSLGASHPHLSDYFTVESLIGD